MACLPCKAAWRNTLTLPVNTSSCANGANFFVQDLYAKAIASATHSSSSIPSRAAVCAKCPTPSKAVACASRPKCNLNSKPQQPIIASPSKHCRQQVAQGLRGNQSCVILPSEALFGSAAPDWVTPIPLNDN